MSDLAKAAERLAGMASWQDRSWVAADTADLRLVLARLSELEQTNARLRPVAEAALFFCRELQEDAPGVPLVELQILNKALDVYEATRPVTEITNPAALLKEHTP